MQKKEKKKSLSIFDAKFSAYPLKATESQLKN